jgi:hypothetical protein
MYFVFFILLLKYIFEFYYSIINVISYYVQNNIDSGSMDSSNGSTSRMSGLSRSLPNVIEDEVDEQLWKLDGKIQRKRDEKL